MQFVLVLLVCAAPALLQQAQAIRYSARDFHGRPTLITQSENGKRLGGINTQIFSNYRNKKHVIIVNVNFTSFNTFVIGSNDERTCE